MNMVNATFVPHPLERHLRQMIAVDTRPRAQIDQFQAGAGRKRTTIRDAHVIPLAGATLPVKQLMLDKMANAGITIRGVLKQGPLKRAAIRQIGLADCYVLATLLCLSLIAPTWLDDYMILPVTLADGTPGCIVFFYEQRTNSIVAITTSLEVSTSYNQPSDDDIRPELIEKTYPFFKTGIEDYLKINWGSLDYATASGLRSAAARQPRELSSAFIDQHRALNRGIIIFTSPNAKVLPYSHAECALDGRTLINPWYGDQDYPVTDALLGNPNEVVVMYALEPANILPKLPTQIVPSPTPSPSPTPEKPMQVTVMNNGKVIPQKASFPFVNIGGKMYGQCALTWTNDPGVVVTLAGNPFHQDPAVITEGKFSSNFSDSCTLALTFTKGAEVVTYIVAFEKQVAPDATPDTKPTMPAVDPPVSMVVTLKSGAQISTSWDALLLAIRDAFLGIAKK